MFRRLVAGCNERSGLLTSYQASRAACEWSEGAGPRGTKYRGTAYVGELGWRYF
ncbi:hypothetical protein [Sphingobacterium sp. DR205]|uniref:hypothetical protein n=1 Tax=Sphingobacterium sp. DR205 TaxID=2713573 RepID=UPI0013E4AEE8|nr:hypothetical protein [Sphingobacterium sp. DR205]QIH32322.1 hypothetical protein G6053_05185 [Sphingobacterium sp. DR205]